MIKKHSCTVKADEGFVAAVMQRLHTRHAAKNDGDVVAAHSS